MQFLHQSIPAVPSPCPPPGWSPDISIFLALDGKFPWRWGLLSSAGIDWCIVISFRKRVLWTALYPESFDLLLIVTGITGVLWENNILITVTQPLRRAKLRLNPCYAMQGPRSHGNMGEFSDRCQVTLMEALWILFTVGNVDWDIGRHSGRYSGRQSVDSRSIVGRQSVDSRSIVGR